MSGGEREDDENSTFMDGGQTGLIPGDNDRPSQTMNGPDVPDNLGAIPASGGDVPNTLAPRLPIVP